MTLFRTGLIIAAAIAVLPSDKGQQQRLYMQTAAAIDWAATYCGRNRGHCDQASAYWTLFKAKAEFAGGLALDGIKRYAMGGTDDAGAPVEGMAAEGTALRARSGTLTGEDMKPRWRGTGRPI